MFNNMHIAVLQMLMTLLFAPRFLNFISRQVAGCYLMTFATAFAEISRMEAT